MRAVGFVGAILCITLGISGCSSPKLEAKAPAQHRQSASERASDADKSFEDRGPASAEEYWQYADTSGDPMAPEVGSPLRQELMDAARLFLGIQTQFVVHSLTVQGELARGVIEPYPVGSDAAYDTTWVLWNGSWSVVDAFVADPNAITMTPSPIPSTPPPASYAPSTQGGMTAEEYRKILEEQRAYEAEQTRIAEERRLAQARADWDAYNAAYQQEWTVQVARLHNIAASRGTAAGWTNADWAEYIAANLPRIMAENGWPAPGSRP